MRIWFPELPSAGLDELDRSQAAVGVSHPVFNLDNTDYFRRYLDDVEVVQVPNVGIGEPTASDTAMTNYFRRYLDDPGPIE